MDLSKIDFDHWMEIGLQRGFVGPPVCYTHDGLPMTPTEEHLMADDPDSVCIHIIRPYESSEHKTEIEGNHAPTNFRNPFVRRG
jgi:hypothetical protein